MTLRPQLGYWGPPHGEAGVDQGMFAVESALGHTFTYFRRRGHYGPLDSVMGNSDDVTITGMGYKLSMTIVPWTGLSSNAIAVPYPNLYNDTSGVYDSILFANMDFINSLSGTGHLLEIHSECDVNNKVQPAGGTPAQYVLWFEYIRSVFEGGPTASGHTHTPIVQPGKVKYITSFIAQGFKLKPTDPLYWTNWLPPLNLVDIIGVDSYSHGGAGDSNTASFTYITMFDAIYTAVLTQTGKPFGIFETGAEELVADPNFKANWYRDAFNYLSTKDRALWPVAFFTDFPAYTYDSSPQAFTAFGAGWTVLEGSGGNLPPAPTITSFNPTFGPVGTSVVLTGTGFTGVFSVLLGSLNCPFTFLSDVQIQVTIPTNAVNGKFSVSTPGGTALSATNFSVTLTSPPSITSFSPTTGPVGTVVTINGTNFVGVSQVLIGTKAMTFTVISSVQIMATVPTGAVTGPIKVTTSNGTATSAVNFVVGSPVPTISTFSPSDGPVGAPVSIIGTGFTGTTSVKFHGVTASFTVVDDSHISTNVPATATSGPITVTTPGGTATSVTFVVDVPPPVPTVDFLNPGSGFIGDFIQVQGTHLLNASAVKFNGVNSQSFTVDDDTQITAQVPIGATDGPVSVITPGGTASSSASFTILVIPPPPPPDPDFLLWDDSLDIWDNPQDTWDGVPSGVPPSGGVLDTTVLICIYTPTQPMLAEFDKPLLTCETDSLRITCNYEQVEITCEDDVLEINAVYSPTFTVEGAP